MENNKFNKLKQLEDKYWIQEKLLALKGKYFVLQNPTSNEFVRFYYKFHEAKFFVFPRTRFLSCYHYFIHFSEVKFSIFLNLIWNVDFYENKLFWLVYLIDLVLILSIFLLIFAFVWNMGLKKENYHYFLKNGWDFASKDDKEIAFKNKAYKRIYEKFKN